MRDYLGNLSNTERALVVRILKNGLKGGVSMKEISGQIAEVINDDERAQVIARTELVRLGNEGNLMRFAEAHRTPLCSGST
jgi:hypothetical protein